MFYIFLADALVLIHASYASFVVVGLVLILLGIVRKWQWVRNPWFRIAHVAAIGIVAIEAVLHVECPLTTWEARLRQAAGQSASPDSFIGRAVHALLFFDVPEWVLNLGHIGFAVIVVTTFVLAPPRLPRFIVRSNGPA